MQRTCVKACAFVMFLLSCIQVVPLICHLSVFLQQIKSCVSQKEYHTHASFCCLQKLLVVCSMKPFEKKSLLDLPSCNWAFHWGKTLYAYLALVVTNFTILNQPAAWCLAGRSRWVWGWLWFSVVFYIYSLYIF